VRVAYDDRVRWLSHERGHLLFSCKDCGAEIVRVVVHGHPDAVVRCFGCEFSHVHHVSDHLLWHALDDASSQSES
jgi:hypothetical protein